jgi:hypothetical protein
VPHPTPCFQIGLTRHACVKCGDITTAVHLPTMQVGYYCEKCCPACNSEKPRKD